MNKCKNIYHTLSEKGKATKIMDIKSKPGVKLMYKINT
jgi:hypothetical protein